MNLGNIANPEDPPPILSPAIREVFHQFASMLDIKSFMKLAMTSKTMYNSRCMEDSMIRINLDEKEVFVSVENGVSTFSFYSFDIADIHIEKYLEKLRQLKCNVSLKRIVIHGGEMNAGTVTEIRRFLEDIGVKSIEKIKIDMNNVNCWKQVVTFIKDFHLKIVEFYSALPEDVLRSSLQLNLKHLFYNRTVSGELLLETDTSIPEIKLAAIEASSDVFMQILWKIQTGSLKRLSTSVSHWFWQNFTQVRSAFDGPLPAERPLLITGYRGERWFVHWNGDVTKCKKGDDRYVEFSKCDQGDLPSVLQTEDAVHKVLAEKSEKGVQCKKRHFISYFDDYPVMDEDHEGSFPEERPILCKHESFNGAELTYYLLNEDGSMDVYSYVGDTECRGKCVGNFNLDERWPEVKDHLALLKFLLKKRIEKRISEGSFECRKMEEFRLLFEDYEPLPHDFRGHLPNSHPVVFAGRKDRRVVLYEDGSLIQYRYENHAFASNKVHIESCPAWNIPLKMITLENLKKIVLEAPYETFTYNVDRNMFRDAFEEIETLLFHTSADLPKERPLAFKNTELHAGKLVDQRLVVAEYGFVRKCEWKDGQATFSRADPREFPFILTKTLVKEYFEGKNIYISLGFYIDRFTLNQCLEGCQIYGYDDLYSPADDRPLIFKKTEVKHTWQRREILHFCVVDDLQEVIHITWGAKEDRFLSFNWRPHPNDLPAALKTKEMLEYVLEDAWDPEEEAKVHWYGSFEDLVSYLEGRKMIDFYHNGPLPSVRPLVFKDDSSMWLGLPTQYWFLRKDDLLIKCEKYGSHVVLTVSPGYGRPQAISRSS